VPAFLKDLYGQDRYRDWLLIAGLGAGLAEAAAELMQARLEAELSPHLDRPGTASGFGRRVSFGYPCCPDLANQPRMFQLLGPESIGVTLTEGLEMDPEFSVSALLFVGAED
jgi:5-methyltetrahydrofolate--homocysteine methyltransferase